MRLRMLVIGIFVALIAAGCVAAPTARPQTAPAAQAAVPTATRVRAQRPTPTPAATEAASVTPTVQPATPTLQPTATTAPSSATVAPTNPKAAPLATGSASGVLLRLDPAKYPAPVLLAPADNAVYHVSQPVVQLTWSGSGSSFMTFGQTPGCVSDATNFRRAFESYQLIVHNVDGAHPDIVQWNENNPEFYLNLTTVPAGRYSWKVNIVTLCESYVVGKRAMTIQRSLVAPASPTSATRLIKWVP